MDFTGIRFNGKHSSDFNILRVSDGDRYQDTLVPDFEDYTESVPGGVGSYYYGSEDKQKEFSLNFAFDKMTEKNLREVRQWLGVKKPCDLIFDEWPYKAYSAKISSPPSFDTICFMENGQRVYKGEISVSMVCYYPYARSVHKTLSEFREPGSYVEGNIPIALNYERDTQLEKISFVPPAVSLDDTSALFKERRFEGDIKGHYCNYKKDHQIGQNNTAPIYVKQYDPNHVHILIPELKQLGTNNYVAGTTIGTYLSFGNDYDENPNNISHTFFIYFDLDEAGQSKEMEVPLYWQMEEGGGPCKAKFYITYGENSGSVEYELDVDQMLAGLGDTEFYIHHFQIYTDVANEWRNAYNQILTEVNTIWKEPWNIKYNSIDGVYNSTSKKTIADFADKNEEYFFGIGDNLPNITITETELIKETKYKKISIDPNNIKNYANNVSGNYNGVYYYNLENANVKFLFCNFFPLINNGYWYITLNKSTKAIEFVTTFTSLESFKKWVETYGLYIWVEIEDIETTKNAVTTNFSSLFEIGVKNELTLSGKWDDDSIVRMSAQTKEKESNNIEEWKDSSGLLSVLDGYDIYNNEKLKLYNPGDLETDYILSHQVQLFEIPSVMETFNSAGFLEEDKTFTLIHSLDGNSFSINGDKTLTPSGTYYKNEFLRKINLIDPTNLDRAYYRLNSQTYDIEPLQNDNREIDNIPVNTSFQTTGGDFYLVFRVKGNGTAVQPIANCLLEITGIDILGADPFKIEIKEGVTSTDSFYIGKTTLDAGRYSIKVLVNFAHFSNLSNCSFSIYLFEVPTGSTSVTGTIKIDSYRKEVYWEANGRKVSLNCLLSKGDFGKIPLSIPGQELSMQIKGINDCIKDATIEYDYLYY